MLVAALPTACGSGDPGESDGSEAMNGGAGGAAVADSDAAADADAKGSGNDGGLPVDGAADRDGDGSGGGGRADAMDEMPDVELADGDAEAGGDIDADDGGAIDVSNPPLDATDESEPGDDAPEDVALSDAEDAPELDGAGPPVDGGHDQSVDPTDASDDALPVDAGDSDANSAPLDATSADVASEASDAEPGPTTIRIATFNIQNFGPTKASHADVMTQLADIVHRYPIVAVQELSDATQQVPALFLNQLNSGGYSYAMSLSPRTGQQADDKSFAEQYAFYYDTTVIAQLGAGALYDDSAYDYFVREPWAARFQTMGGWTFVAITIHTQPTNTIFEIDHLADVASWAAAQFPAEDDFILLGDMNAGCSYATPTALDTTRLRSAGYVWVVPDTADTNLASAACAYDRIVLRLGSEANYAAGWGVDASFASTTISDHWPVWAEFWADER